MPSRSLCRYGPNGPPTPGPSSQLRPSQRSVSCAEAMYSGFTLVTSVSSIRSTNTPPVARANAQSYRAVLMLPTCRSPLGEGANRTLTPRGPGAALPCSVTFVHLVRQGADPFDRHRYLISRLRRSWRAAAGGRPGEQHISGQERHHVTRVRDQVGHATAKLPGGPALPGFPVHRGGQR